MSFRTLLKNKHNRLLSKTWRASLESREVEKNNFLVLGDLHKAKEFAHAASVYKESPRIAQEEVIEPTLIYSRAIPTQAFA